ncbi:helix-turn-helix domain-containing protein [Cohnella cellulosilytica]|uniref:Helix-turn-helix domain-containing protein n=1 Tax=Cohnella cellulosilytica TaxID=986710 RepID=A0ABW2F4Y4_9BACL
MDELAQGVWLLPWRIERVRLTKGMKWEACRTDRHLLAIAVAGEGRAKLNGSSARLCKRRICGVRPGQHFEVAAAAGAEELLELLVLEFAVHRPARKAEGDSLNAKAETELLGMSGWFAVPAEESTVALGERLAEQWETADELARLRLHALFLEFVYRMVRDEREHGRRQAGDPLEAARQRMHDRYNENVTVGQLARWAGSSATHFRERFRSRYGIGPLEYLTAARLRAARRLLLSADRSVREVAHQVGYRDEFYFSRLFKKRVGLAPSAYAQSRDRRIAALGYPAVGQLLALGVRPAAAALNDRWSAYYRSYYRIELPLFRTDPFAAEADELLGELGRLSPDAIIGGGFQDRLLRERLDRIAPVLFTPWSDSDWREQLRTTAAFIGRSEEAERFLSGYGRKAAAARERLSASVGRETVMAMCVSQDRLLVYGRRNIGAVLYEDLGLHPARNVAEIDDVAEVAAERLAEFEADRILLMVWEDEASRAAWSRLRSSAHWQRLRAVRSQRVQRISPFPWLEYTAFAHNAVIDEALKLFAAKRPVE